jgi:tRNA threonylcarbamoyladenosine biosynthesis protein TsaE
MELKVSSLKMLPEVAKQILEYAGENRIFLFYGEMGAGKTTLIKELCKALGVIDTVSSPTFSIVNEYQGEWAIIYHFDFYRIKNQTEAFDLGYEDYVYSGNFCFIEWPEKISGLLPEKYVEVRLKETSQSERMINVDVLN